MIRDDRERVIGKLISINSEKFTVELLNQSINFTVNGYDDIYQYAQINGYVILPYQDFYIIAEIFGVREKDADIKWKGEKEQILSKSNSVKYLDITPIGTIQGRKFRYGVSVFPTLYSDVLYIKKEELDIVFEVTNETEEISIEGVKGSKLNLLDIGTSTIFPGYKVKVDINGFFGGHTAILGNTGSGKSCTISSMVQTLFTKEGFSASGASFIFFDVNGEYHRAFSQIKNPEIQIKYYSLNEIKTQDYFVEQYKTNDNQFEVNSNIEYEEFKLPHWFLNIDEWALLLKASERTQQPILRSALGFTLIEDEAKFNHIVSAAILHTVSLQENSAAKGQRMYSLLNRYGQGDLNIALLDKYQFSTKFGNFNSNVDQDNFVKKVSEYQTEDFQIPSYTNGKNPFEFSDLEHLIDLAILYEEAYGNKQIRDYCSSLLTRLKSLGERDEFDFLTGSDGKENKEKFIDDLLGIEESKEKKTQVSIIDLNTVDDDVVEVISCVVSRIIFERLKSLKSRNTFPVNLVLEEAHRYIATDSGKTFESANRIFERIAKEGRKYGLFLLVSSQRPSELSKTVLSQCGSFIIHRIQNPEDLLHIKQMTPHISSNILSRLPSIPKQHALVFGHSVQIPTLFKVNNAHPTPHSHDNKVSDNWFRPKKNEPKIS